MIESKVLADGSKNYMVSVTGALDRDLADSHTILDVSTLGRRLKLESAVWLIQEKMGLVLWWGKGTQLFPMESRNALKLERGLDSPNDWDGTMQITSFGFDSNTLTPKRFWFILDFDKQ